MLVRYMILSKIEPSEGESNRIADSWNRTSTTLNCGILCSSKYVRFGATAQSNFFCKSQVFVLFLLKFLIFTFAKNAFLFFIYRMIY